MVSLLAFDSYAQQSDEEAVLEATDGATKVFAPEEFARFVPRTALDMVQQIPGFSISESDNDSRGLGQADDNVLLNGKRTSGKTNDAITALGRISAENVIRIEILDGASLDIPGLSGQVVNVVFANSDGVSGQFAWRPEFRLRRVSPNFFAGEASINGSYQSFDYTVSIQNNSSRRGSAGVEFVVDSTGDLIDVRDEDSRFSADNPIFSTSLDYTGEGGAIGNLDLAYAQFNFVSTEESLRNGIDQADRDRNFRNSEDEWNFEGSGDYEFGVGPGRLKLIAFQRFEHSPTVNLLTTEFADGTTTTGSRFARVSDEGESILRSEYGWRTSAGSDWQVAAEGAFNFLDVESELESLDELGNFIPVALDGSTSRVEEIRGELSTTYGTVLAPNWSWQTSLGAEYSELSQSGENGQTRSFVRPKGFTALTWQPNTDTSITWRIERLVGQLDFSDFVASVNIDLANQNVGNPDIVPQQSWLGEIVATQKFGDYGSANLRLYGELITDITDQIPIGDDAEAPGNIDSAAIYGFEFNGTLLFDPLGWHGARVDVDLQVQDSTVDDPLTGIPRSISRTLVYEVESIFRHDIPSTDWAYGASYADSRNTSNVRLGETRRFVARPGNLSAFVEHKNVFGLTVNAAVSNLLSTEDEFIRTSFENRNDGPIAFREERIRTFGQIIELTISGTF